MVDRISLDKHDWGGYYSPFDADWCLTNSRGACFYHQGMHKMLPNHGPLNQIVAMRHADTLPFMDKIKHTFQPVPEEILEPIRDQTIIDLNQPTDRAKRAQSHKAGHHANDGVGGRKRKSVNRKRKSVNRKRNSRRRTGRKH